MRRQELVRSQGNRLPELLKASPLCFQFQPECCFIQGPGFHKACSPRPQLLWRAPCLRLWEGYLLPPSVPLVPGIVVSLCYCKKIFWPQHVACGILVPESGIEPKPGEVRAQSPKPWTTRDFLLLQIMRWLTMHLFGFSALLSHDNQLPNCREKYQ